jgi:hypothetical protein
MTRFSSSELFQKLLNFEMPGLNRFARQLALRVPGL